MDCLMGMNAHVQSRLLKIFIVGNKKNAHYIIRPSRDGYWFYPIVLKMLRCICHLLCNLLVLPKVDYKRMSTLIKVYNYGNPDLHMCINSTCLALCSRRLFKYSVQTVEICRQCIRCKFMDSTIRNGRNKSYTTIIMFFEIINRVSNGTLMDNWYFFYIIRYVHIIASCLSWENERASDQISLLFGSNSGPDFLSACWCFKNVQWVNLLFLRVKSI